MIEPMLTVSSIPVDDDTPIEAYPGYIGHTWDGEFFPGPELAFLTRLGC